MSASAGGFQMRCGSIVASCSTRIASSSRSIEYAARRRDRMAESAAVVLGAGAWGTALACILTRSHRDVRLGIRRSRLLAVMAAKRENPYLPGVTLPANLKLTDDWRTAALGAGTVIIAIPSEFFRASIEPIIGGIKPDANLISAAKGIENG